MRNLRTLIRTILNRPVVVDDTTSKYYRIIVDHVINEITPSGVTEIYAVQNKQTGVKEWRANILMDAAVALLARP